MMMVVMIDFYCTTGIPHMTRDVEIVLLNDER
jgi:hypothetical protein